MNDDIYQTLVNLQLLENRYFECAQEVAIEKKRLDDLDLLTKARQDRLDLLCEEDKREKAELVKKEKELSSLVQGLEQSKDHFREITSQTALMAFEKEKLDREGKKDRLEEEIFLVLEKEEMRSKEMTSLKRFLEGAKASREEIEKEVNVSIEKIEEKKKKYDGQQKQLLDLLPHTAKEHFLRLNKKFHFKRPLTVVVGQNCKECHMALTRKEQMELSSNDKLTFCSGCGRLLVPSELL